MRIPLLGGSYKARSIIASAQRCLNLFPETNPQDALAPKTHYPTPGLTLLMGCPAPDLARCLYRASTGALFAVVGSNVYSISSAWSWTQLGTITYAATPCSMSDNGTTAVLVDGSPNGYQITLATNAFSQITDPNFLGSTRADFIDTFLLFNEPRFPTFYTSGSNTVTFDALYFADKTAAADPLVAAIAIHDQIWLIGTLTTEIWYNDGGATFPFAKFPGAFIEQGCCAWASVAKQDNNIYWLGQDLQGRCVVMQGLGYTATRISTFAIENEIQSYGTVSDAVGYTYQQNGHTFYVLRFPTANRTWVYDAAEQEWHERGWIDTNGKLHQHRAGFAAYAYGSNVALDWQTGALYLIDPNNYTDNGDPIARVRSFPHLMGEGKRVMYQRFIADMDVGQQPAGLTSAPPVISLRYSDTRGASWGNPVTQSLGSTGQYAVSIQFQRLGMGRDRVFELSWSAPYATALNGAFIDMTAVGT